MQLLSYTLWTVAKGFPGSSAGKAFACNARDLGLIPGLGRSPGEGKSDSLQYSSMADEFTIINSWSLLKLMSIESVMPSNHLILCHPFLFLPSVFPSMRVFFDESVLHIRWSKYWNFSFIISPPNEYSGLISFRMDWFALLAVHGTLRVFSYTIVQKHQFFGAQLSL